MRIDHPPPTPPSGFSSSGSSPYTQLISDFQALQSDLNERLDPTDPTALDEFISDFEAIQKDIQSIQKSGGNVPARVTLFLAQLAPKTNISINTILGDVKSGDNQQAREDAEVYLTSFGYPNSSQYNRMIQQVINSMQ